MKLYSAFSAILEYKIQTTENKTIKYKNKNKNTKCTTKQNKLIIASIN